MRIELLSVLLFTKKDFHKLLDLYKDLEVEKKEKLATLLENKLLSSAEPEEYYNIFSGLDDKYGVFYKLMAGKIELDAINDFDFNNLPIFFVKIFKRINDIDKIIYIFKKINSSNKLKNIFSYLIQWNILSEESVLKILSEIEKSNEFILQRMYIDIAIVLILHWSTNKFTINTNRLDTFIKYLQKGSEYINSFLKLSEETLKNEIFALEDELRVFIIYRNTVKSLNIGNLLDALKGFRHIAEIENNFAIFISKIIKATK